MLLVVYSVIGWTFIVKIKATKTNIFHKLFLNSYKMLTKMCFSLILILFPNNFQSNFSFCFALFIFKKCQSRQRSGSTFNDSWKLSTGWQVVQDDPQTWAMTSVSPFHIFISVLGSRKSFFATLAKVPKRLFVYFDPKVNSGRLIFDILIHLNIFRHFVTKTCEEMQLFFILIISWKSYGSSLIT